MRDNSFDSTPETSMPFTACGAYNIGMTTEHRTHMQLHNIMAHDGTRCNFGNGEGNTKSVIKKMIRKNKKKQNTVE